MRNEFQRHKRSDKIKWVLTSIALVLAFIMIAGLCLQLFGTGKQKPSEWFNKQEQTDKLPDESGEVGGLLIPEATAGNGISLMSARIATADYEDYGISTQVESAYTLTATITPASADDKRVEWTVAPKSGNTNAKDYIMLTANGLTATVACKQAFDVQFIVTCKSLDNPEAKATCTLDYVERLLGVTVNMPQLTSQTAEVTYTTQSSKYTIKSNIGVTFSNFVFNNAFRGELVAYIDGIPDDGYNYLWFHPTYTNQLVQYTSAGLKFLNGKAISATASGGLCDLCPDGLVGCIVAFSGQAFDGLLADEGDAISAFRSACESENLGTVDVTVSATYGGKTYNSIKKTVEIWVDGSSFHISVNSVSLSNGSLVF